MKTHCCERMTDETLRSGEEHSDHSVHSDILLSYLPHFDEYGINIHDGGGAMAPIDFCPWCGQALPKSKRDRWFQELEELGIDNPYEQEIPERFKDASWYTN